jgi:ankyrin repeat protein
MSRKTPLSPLAVSSTSEQKYVQACNLLFDHLTSSPTVAVVKELMLQIDQNDPLKEVQQITFELDDDAAEITDVPSIDVYDRDGRHVHLMQASVPSNTSSFMQFNLTAAMPIARVVVQLKKRDAAQVFHLKCRTNQGVCAMQYTVTGEQKRSFGHVINAMGETPLHVVTSGANMDVEVVNLLCDASFGPAAMVACDNAGVTPLLRALRAGSIPAVIHALLNDQSVRVDFAAFQITPLHSAYDYGHPLEIVRAIRQLRPEAQTMKNHRGKLPHELGILEGRLANVTKDTNIEMFLDLLDVVKSLVGEHAALAEGDDAHDGLLPIHGAVWNGCGKDILYHLIRQGSKVELMTPLTSNGNLPLHLCLKRGINDTDQIEEQAKFLIGKEEDMKQWKNPINEQTYNANVYEQLTTKNHHGHLPLHLALMRDFSEEFIQYIVKLTIQSYVSSGENDVDFMTFPAVQPSYVPHIGDTFWLQEEVHGVPAKTILSIVDGPDFDDQYKLMNGRSHEHYPNKVTFGTTQQQTAKPEHMKHGSTYRMSNSAQRELLGEEEENDSETTGLVAYVGSMVPYESKKPSKFQFYLANGNILHALLNMEHFDSAFYHELKNRLKNKFNILVNKKDDFGEYPIDTAKRCNRNLDIISALWQTMSEKKTVTNAIRWGLYKEALARLDYDGPSAYATVDLDHVDHATKALMTCLQLEIRDEDVSVLEAIQKKIIMRQCDCLLHIPADFKIRAKILQLAMYIQGERTLEDILTRNVGHPEFSFDRSVHKNMRSWYNEADLTLLRGDETAATLKNIGKQGQRLFRTTNHRRATWGYRGYLWKHGKVFYEVTVLKKGRTPQIGWADETFEICTGFMDEGVGDDLSSWGIDGVRKKAWHKNKTDIQWAWQDGDVLGVAIDLDGGQATFRMSVNGVWANEPIFKNMEYSGGLFPAITHDGVYAINFGEAMIEYPPPTDEYQTVLQSIQCQTRIDELVAYAHENSRTIPTEQCEIFERQHLLFVDGEVYGNKWRTYLNDKNCKWSYIRLKQSCVNKIIEYFQGAILKARQLENSVIIVDMSYSTDVESKIVRTDLRLSDVEVAIDGSTLHFMMTSYGASSERDAQVSNILRCYGGASVEMKDAAGRYPLQIAADTNVSVNVRRAIYQQMSSKELFTAIQAQLWDEVKYLLKHATKTSLQNVGRSSRSQDYDHAIHLAARYGAPRNILEAILHVDPDCLCALGRFNRTVLHYGIMTTCMDVKDIQFLLDQDPVGDLLTTSDSVYGMNPVHLAAAKRYPEIVQCLVMDGKKKGKDMRTTQDRNGRLPLHWAVDVTSRLGLKHWKFSQRAVIEDRKYYDTVDALVDEQGHVLNQENRESYTALHLAIMSDVSTPAVVRRLLSLPAKPSLTHRELDLAAQYATNEAIFAEICNNPTFGNQIVSVNEKEHKMSALHYASKYNSNARIVRLLMKKESEYLSKYPDQLHRFFVTVPDDNGNLPLHHACESRFSPPETMVALIEQYKDIVHTYRTPTSSTNYILTKLGEFGGADKVNKRNDLPLHLAINADADQTAELYSRIINVLIDTFPQALFAEQSPLVLALQTSRRLRKLDVQIVTKMLSFYNHIGDAEQKQEIPDEVDLSLYFTTNETAFQECCDGFAGIFTTRCKNLGTKLPCLYPYLFRGRNLRKSGDNRKTRQRLLKYWFVLHASMFEGVEYMRKNGKDIPGGLKSLTEVAVEGCIRDDLLREHPAADTPARNLVQDNQTRTTWLTELLNSVDPTDGPLRPDFPKCTSPLAYAIRHGVTKAILSLSMGGCNPKADAFPRNMEWNISNYGLANCASIVVSEGVSYSSTDVQRWKAALAAMRNQPDEQSRRDKNACKRLFTCRKLPLESLTILLMVFVGILTSTSYETSQLRFNQHIIDKFTDEEFRAEDSHIKKTFFDIGNIEEFWQWVDGPLVNGLYEDGEVRNGRSMIDDVSSVVGSVRILQNRIAPSPCTNSIGISMKNLPNGGCFNGGKAIWQTEPFGPAGKYKYTKPNSELYESDIRGHWLWGYRYSNGGYSILLPGGNLTKAKQILRELKEESFVSIKDGTRSIIIDFGIYNSHVDRVASVRLMVEFYPLGGTQPSSDLTVLEWEAVEDSFKMEFMTNFLMIIFIFRAFFEIDEMAWGNLTAMAKQIEFGDTSFDYKDYADGLNFELMRKSGLDLGKGPSVDSGGARYSWRPCSSLTRARPQRKALSSVSELLSKDRNQGYEWSPCCCISSCTRRASNSRWFRVKLFAVARDSVYNLASEAAQETHGPYARKRNADMNTCARLRQWWVRTMNGIHVEFFVVCNFLLGFGSAMAWNITKKVEDRSATNKDDSQETTTFEDDRQRRPSHASRLPSTFCEFDEIETTEESETKVEMTSAVGTDNKYHDRCCSFWWQSLTRNKYFTSGWNVYEWLLILLYASYFAIEKRREKLTYELRETMVRVMDEMTDEFVPLDELSYNVMMSQDLVAIVFIFVCIHLLRIMQEIPYGVGARVMAILKVIGHQNVIPFYFTIIVMFFSFAFGIHFAFANDMVEYRHIFSSFQNVFFASFGDFGIGIDGMMDSHELVAFVIVMISIALLTLIMMNIFIGVVGVVYEETERLSLAQFEVDLDKYQRSTLDDDSRVWAREAIFSDFRTNLTMAKKGDEQTHADNAQSLIEFLKNK